MVVGDDVGLGGSEDRRMQVGLKAHCCAPEQAEHEVDPCRRTADLAQWLWMVAAEPLVSASVSIDTDLCMGKLIEAAEDRCRPSTVRVAALQHERLRTAVGPKWPETDNRPLLERQTGDEVLALEFSPFWCVRLLKEGDDLGLVNRRFIALFPLHSGNSSSVWSEIAMADQSILLSGEGRGEWQRGTNPRTWRR